MGKDRNKPLFIRLARRDHYDDKDVSVLKIQKLSFLAILILTSFSVLDLQIQLALVLSERSVSEHKSGHWPV